MLLQLDAHIAELLKYGKLPEIVDSMQARREAAERVKRNIRRVNEEAHRIDTEAAAELRKETEKLRAFSRKLDDINAMLVSVMNPEAVTLSNDSGAGVGKTDMVTAFEKALRVYQQEISEDMIICLTALGISEGSLLYKACIEEFQKMSIPTYVIRNEGMHAYGSGTYNRDNVLKHAVWRVYAYREKEACQELDDVLAKNKELEIEINRMMKSEGVIVRQIKLDEWDWGGGKIDAEKFNRIMKAYDITDTGSLTMFMATCRAESNGKILEEGTDAYFRKNGYGADDRGVGYTQLTHREEQQKFLEHMKNSENCDVENIAEYIAKHYDMWEVAAYTWSVKTYGDGVILNDYIIRRTETGAKREDIFLSTQYFINGYPNGQLYGRGVNKFGSRMSGILDMGSGKKNNVIGYKIVTETEGDNGRLVIEVESETGASGYEEYYLPNGWKERQEAYYEAVKVFMEE